MTDGIREQVRHDAFEHERVPDDGEVGRDIELDPRPLRHGSGHDLAQDARQNERPRHHPDRASVEAREIEQLLDQTSHPVGLLVRHLDQLLARLRRELEPLDERRQRAVDRRRRRAQLVRRDRDEVQLQLVELPRLLVKPRTLDRERNALRDELQELDVVRR